MVLNSGPKLYDPDRVLIRYIWTGPRTSESYWKNESETFQLKKFIFTFECGKFEKKFLKIFGVFMIKWTFRLIALGLE